MTEQPSKDERRFPIMGRRERTLTSVPWSAVEAVEDQIVANHSQSVEALARRGGLTAHELLAALKGERWSSRLQKTPLAEAEGEVLSLIEGE